MPFLARLGNSGTINAWSVDSQNSWIQVRVDKKNKEIAHLLANSICWFGKYQNTKEYIYNKLCQSKLYFRAWWTHFN